jgi:ABC-type polar amino acid transport system ATPase subunit
MLSARHLSFDYGGRPVLTDVSLDIKPGSITVLIGPSGTGKTTLLRCLAMLATPQRGEIQVDEQLFRYPTATNLPTPTPPWPKLTAVFQQLFLWPHLTLRQNILLPMRLQEPAGVATALEELIEAFDMGNFIDRYPNQASLGQRQRAALARAIILNPRYLLLDEVTSALDVEQITRVLGYLAQLRQRDMGLFIITHLLGFARQTADQVVFMAKGSIVERGDVSILTNPQSQRLQQFLAVATAMG